MNICGEGKSCKCSEHVTDKMGGQVVICVAVLGAERIPGMIKNRFSVALS